LSSRSSNNAGRRFLPLGRVTGHRGAKGELTVRLARGEAEIWTGVELVWIGKPGSEIPYRVASSRAYRDRLVLKLEGIDRADAAARLKGMNAVVAEGDEPELPENVYHVARLVGMEVRDEAGGLIGKVSDVMPTAGADLLIVALSAAREDRKGEEAMIPLTEEIVLEVLEDENRIIVRLPEGLLDLNRN
jgi:16S rRNA processing protein RimM